MMPDLKPELEAMIRNISQRNMYSGNKIPDSIMKIFEIEENDDHIGVLVPYWLSVFERGRGPRKSNTDHGLWKRIYAWMAKRNMFRSTTPEGKINEAKGVTWYINKYGNKQFRTKTYVDIYNSERKRTIDKVNQKVGIILGQITNEIL